MTSDSTEEAAEKTEKGKLIETSKLTKVERKKLRQAQIQQSVLYEYVISDSETKVFDLYNEFTTDVTMGATYSNFLFFYVKGKKHLVFVENQ